MIVCNSYFGILVAHSGKDKKLTMVVNPVSRCARIDPLYSAWFTILIFDSNPTTMSNEKKLVDVMLDVLAEIHEMRKGMDGMRGDISELRGDFAELRVQQEKTNSELVKVNLQLGENTRAILKLADKVEVVPNLVERVVKLEAEVFRKAS